MRLRDWTAARRYRQDPESGQATTEFALLLPVFLILVVGIINFGIGLNFWLDMQRIANQGARWAVVETTATARVCAGPVTPSTGPVHTLCRDVKNHPFGIPISAAQ